MSSPFPRLASNPAFPLLPCVETPPHPPTARASRQVTGQFLAGLEAEQWHSKKLPLEPAGLGLKAGTVVFISTGISLGLSFST